MADTITVRMARRADRPPMIALAGCYREKLEQLEPRYWRRAANAPRWTRLYFGLLMWRRSWILVAERQGVVVGFVIALPKRAPPIFAPGTKTALIDDFCVAPDQDFAVIGAALLGAIRPRLRASGFGQLVVINASGDRQFGAFLEAQGIRPVCQWSLGES